MTIRVGDTVRPREIDPMTIEECRAQISTDILWSTLAIISVFTIDNHAFKITILYVFLGLSLLSSAGNGYRSYRERRIERVKI